MVPGTRRVLSLVPVLVAGALLVAPPAAGQAPAGWGPEPEFHTFSIAAIDPETGESGVAVTTRRMCVGNAVPWVRPGIGAVATQGGTRLEYGNDVLDLLERGVPAAEALEQVVAADEGRERRQVGVIDMRGRTAQWTGSGQYGEEDNGDWVAERSGATFAVQGNGLVGPQVVDSVVAAFRASEGSGRHLADRMIEAIMAGQRIGGDGRHGANQSAAVLVADPRPGMSGRPDGVTVDINVCEHAEPVREMRRIYDTVSQTLGHRTLRRFEGRDVLQLKLILHHLGYFRPDLRELDLDAEGADVYGPSAMDAVDGFRAAEGWAREVGGFVDDRTVARLWQRLDESEGAAEVRRRIRALARVDR